MLDDGKVNAAQNVTERHLVVCRKSMTDALPMLATLIKDALKAQNINQTRNKIESFSSSAPSFADLASIST